MLAIKLEKRNPQQQYLMTITWTMLSFLIVLDVVLMILDVHVLWMFGLNVIYVILLYILYKMSKRYIVNMVSKEEAKSLQQQVMQSREYRAQLRKILDELDLGIIVVDKNRIISYINTNAKQLFDIMDDIRHHHIDETLIPKEVIHYIDMFYVDHITQTEYMTHERIYDIRLSEIILYEDETSLMMIFDDITLEKSTDQMKKDFFSYASHELKSPLTSIRGYAELLQHEMIPLEEQKEVANQIVSQSNVMSTLVEDMLMLSRLENYQESKRILVRLDTKLNEVIETLKPIFMDKNIIIETDLHMIKFLSDPLDMIKLFKNPIENSIKYSPKDSKIRVLLHQKEDMIIFQVKDEGYGIPEKYQSRVFERFYRIEKDRIQGGTGLGLAIVKHIVLKYKGQYQLSSIPNQGTSIHIQIPMKKN